jgi:hypothetical protein
LTIATFMRGGVQQHLRGAQLLSFTDAANVIRRTAVSDGGGGAAWTWSVVAGTIPCRVYPVTPRGRGAIVGGALDEKTTHYCAFPTGTDVNTADRIVVADRGTFDVTMAATRTDQLTRLVEVMQS